MLPLLQNETETVYAKCIENSEQIEEDILIPIQNQRTTQMHMSSIYYPFNLSPHPPTYF